jgi:hypothetical protein
MHMGRAAIAFHPRHVEGNDLRARRSGRLARGIGLLAGDWLVATHDQGQQSESEQTQAMGFHM